MSQVPNMPSITLAQWIGLALAAIGPTLVLVGVNLSADQKDALNELTNLAMTLLGADAVIRVGRNLRRPPATEGE